MKLTTVQFLALKAVERRPGAIYGHRRQTLEALRRRGLVARYTHYSIRAEWAEGNQIREQWLTSARNPIAIDDWEITNLGRAALEQSKEK